jgi:endonuclease G, mitochondrial
MEELEDTPEKTEFNNGLIDPELILNEVKSKINDAEVFEEIKKKFDFASDALFVESFKDNYHSHSEKSTIFKNSIFDGGIENLSTEQIFTIASETIVLKFGRPSLLIQNDQFEMPESEIWIDRLTQFKNSIYNNILSIGRIELVGHSTYDWVGTGWLYENTGLLITNRHVAEVFAAKRNGKFSFRQNLEGKTLKSYIDFKEEFKVDKEAIFKIIDIVYIASDDEPDVAILEVKLENEENMKLPMGLSIEDNMPTMDSFVYTIGYPAKDSRIVDSNLMEEIFKNVYDVKRLAPGKITNIMTDNYESHHDCSTLGGNSGSPVIDLITGKVVGLHHAGTYRKYNWAVQGGYLKSLLKSVT